MPLPPTTILFWFVNRIKCRFGIHFVSVDKMYKEPVVVKCVYCDYPIKLLWNSEQKKFQYDKAFDNEIEKKGKEN